MGHIYGERLLGCRKISSVTNDSITIVAGDAGVAGTAITVYAPILNALGDDIGVFGDSSFSVSGSILTNEVAQASLVLNNGDYYVNYATGALTYIKAASGATVTGSYKVSVMVNTVYA
jgi:hypothetical protein